jgi:hypothetical protein
MSGVLVGRVCGIKGVISPSKDSRGHKVLG